MQGMTGVPAGLRDALGGRYLLLRELARGGMATVYLARDDKHQRNVAVKVLSADISLTVDAERFRREIAVIASLRHPNIVPLYDSGEVDGRQYYVMPLIAGESLRERIARSGQLALPDVRRITSEVAAALEYAHRHGVVHRDVKPANVLLDDEHAVVADFGIARPASVEAHERLTISGTFLGTPAYMSPEQATGAAPLDARTDIYSLGCVVYEMLTGHAPYTASSIQAVLGQHLTSPLPSVTAERASLGREVDAVLGKALAKEPSSRFSSAADFADHLESALTASASGYAHSSATRAGARRFVSWLRQPLALGIMLMAAIAIAWWGMKAVEGRILPIQALMVLPLENLTGDSSQEYFVDGMHEALIAQLSQLSGVRVISRTSSMHYKRTAKSLPEIARELNVDAAVEGSVRRAGDSVRIQLQLVRARPERQMWNRTYERRVGDVLALHSQIAGAVAQQIAASLSPSAVERRSHNESVHPEAYEEFLKGRYFLAQAPANLAIAVRHFENAVVRDSAFAPAHAGLAESCWWFAQTGRPELFSKSRVAARMAVDLDPTLAEAHVAAALARMTDWDWAGSEAAFKRAIQLNPNSSSAHQWYAQLLRIMLRLDEAISEARQAADLDPFSLTVRAMVGWVLFNQRRYEEALDAYTKVLELEPEHGLSIYNQGLVYWMQGKPDKVIDAARRSKAARLTVGELHADWLLVIGFAMSGRHDDARRLLTQLQSRTRPPQEFLAGVQLALGHPERALDHLERALATREPNLPLFTSEPVTDPLRQHPRFRALRAAMRLP
jgi:serine/threonine-protein kinase